MLNCDFILTGQNIPGTGKNFWNNLKFLTDLTVFGGFTLFV